MSQDTNSVFAVSGKSLEGLDEKALLALSAECQKNILLSEVSLARAYWDWGPILVELKKLHKGDWTEWKQKNLPGRKADKALSIHKRYETPDLLGDHHKPARRRLEAKNEYDLPEGWEEAVYEWLSDNDPSAVENRDDQGGYPSEEQLRKAFESLGYQGQLV